MIEKKNYKTSQKMCFFRWVRAAPRTTGDPIKSQKTDKKNPWGHGVPHGAPWGNPTRNIHTYTLFSLKKLIFIEFPSSKNKFLPKIRGFLVTLSRELRIFIKNIYPYTRFSPKRFIFIEFRPPKNRF